MGSIIAAFIAVLGPLLSEFLINWIKGLFARVSKNVKATGNPEKDALALVDAALAATPRRRVFKRALLSRVREHAPKLAKGSRLTNAERAELTTLAGAAEDE